MQLLAQTLRVIPECTVCLVTFPCTLLARGKENIVAYARMFRALKIHTLDYTER